VRRDPDIGSGGAVTTGGTGGTGGGGGSGTSGGTGGTTGGSTGAGGSATGAGGSATGGTGMGTGGSVDDAAEGSPERGGCSIAMPVGRSSFAELGAFLLVALSVLGRRRRG
jgi:hypothetical protein